MPAIVIDRASFLKYCRDQMITLDLSEAKEVRVFITDTPCRRCGK